MNLETPLESYESDHPGQYWSSCEDGRIRCELCPRFCRLKEGQRGFCYVRRNHEGRMSLTTYGRSSGFCIDPIEKKPLNHFYPGSSVLSFGTAGCNLGCKFCQNWDISKSRSDNCLASEAKPEAIAAAAKANACRSVAFTYNDPVIFAEYAIDTALACHELGIKTVAVSAGYISDLARPDFYRHFDAANIDLKAFSERFYQNICSAHLQPVLDTLEYLKRETDVWFEITTLLIPDENDSEAELHALCGWVAEKLGTEVPLHFTAFHPDFKMLEHRSTPAATLRRAREIAMGHGLKFVYVGNVHDRSSSSSYCPGCKALLIERDWYQLGSYELDPSGCCRFCGTRIPGRFGLGKENWGARRKPIEISRV